MSNATRQITDLETIKVGDYVYALRLPSGHRVRTQFRLIKVVDVRPTYSYYGSASEYRYHRLVGVSATPTKRLVYTDSFFWTYYTPPQADIEKFEAKVKQLASAPTPIER